MCLHVCAYLSFSDWGGGLNLQNVCVVLSVKLLVGDGVGVGGCAHCAGALMHLCLVLCMCSLYVDSRISRITIFLGPQG